MLLKKENLGQTARRLSSTAAKMTFNGTAAVWANETCATSDERLNSALVHGKFKCKFLVRA